MMFLEQSSDHKTRIDIIVTIKVVKLQLPNYFCVIVDNSVMTKYLNCTKKTKKLAILKFKRISFATRAPAGLKDAKLRPL